MYINYFVINFAYQIALTENLLKILSSPHQRPDPYFLAFWTINISTFLFTFEK